MIATVSPGWFSIRERPERRAGRGVPGDGERLFGPRDRWVWACGLLANFTPGKQKTWVNFHNEDRAPLLFLAGGADHIMPASVNKSNAQHYKAAGTVTEFYEFPGRSHWTCGEPGWEQVADRALEWALTQAR